MSNKIEFVDLIAEGYKSKGETIALDAAMLGDETLTGSLVNIPLKTSNRHGLISRATGTGKTKILQVFPENLSEKGIPVLLMDLKCDYERFFYKRCFWNIEQGIKEIISL